MSWLFAVSAAMAAESRAEATEPPPEAPPAESPPAESPPAESPPAESPPPEAPPAESPPPEAPPAESPPAESPPAESPPVESSPAQAVPDLSAAEQAPTVTKKQLRLFKPSPYHLPANPRQQIDFTAYTLEWGEVKLGVASMTVGILPHVQLGTSVPLDVLGIPNVHGKVHVTEKGPWDIAALGQYYVLPRQVFSGRYIGAGALVSIQPVEPWSIPLGGPRTSWRVAGDIQLDNLSQLLWFLDSGVIGDADHADSILEVTTVGARAATDLRFNRRDSIVIQGEAIVWATVDRDDELWVPTFLGLEETLAYDGAVPIESAGVASIAWQFAWEHWELRLGWGISSVPAAWLLQSTELSYRFGGPSPKRARRMRETWEKNKDELPKGLEQADDKKKKK